MQREYNSRNNFGFALSLNRMSTGKKKIIYAKNNPMQKIILCEQYQSLKKCSKNNNLQAIPIFF